MEVRVLSRALTSLLSHIFAEYFRSAKRKQSFPLALCRADRLTYFFPVAFLLAAHRAFISWESLLRPAGEIPPFLTGVVFMPAFCLAQRALAAAASLARVAADIRRRPPRATGPAGAPPTLMIEERRFSRVSICRRIEMASCKASTDISISRHITGVSSDGNQLLL